MAEQGERAGARVLVAAVEAGDRQALADLLQGAGCHCDLAEDGIAAVELAAAEAYDLILLDVDLPALNAAQCRQAIAGLPGPRGRVPVVAVVPESAAPVRLERYRIEGFAGLLRRPVGVAEVLACMAAPADTDEAAIDLEHLRRYTLGDRQLESELFRTFLPNAAAYLERMATTVDPREWEEAAHALKGAARGIGAFAIGDLAERAEQADAAGAARVDLLDRLRGALARAERFVAAHLDISG